MIDERIDIEKSITVFHLCRCCIRFLFAKNDDERQNENNTVKNCSADISKRENDMVRALSISRIKSDLLHYPNVFIDHIRHSK